MSDDEDMKRAMALSLEESTRNRPGAISIDSDEEVDQDAEFQRQLELALAASKADATGSNSPTHSETEQPPVAEPPSAFISERAKLEKERLARSKRLRREAGLDDSDEEEQVTKKQRTTNNASHHDGGASGSRSNNTQASGSGSNPKASATTSADGMFWNGELRPTATQHAHPRKDGRPTFRLTDVLGDKSDMAFAIISSYALELPWIYQLFDPTVPVIVCTESANREASIRNVLPNWVQANAELKPQYSCMHMKFMLICYKSGRLRVVVSTANLIPFDYRDIENYVWLQDLPKRVSPGPLPSNDFPVVLKTVLVAINAQRALDALLGDGHPNIPIKSFDDFGTKWDWSQVKAHLVPTIMGKHVGWTEVLKTGHLRLLNVIRSAGLRPPAGKKLVLECQGSSIGSYTSQWLNEFYLSAQGATSNQYGQWLQKSKGQQDKSPFPPVKVAFPTLKTVQASAHGELGGGTLFCTGNKWKDKVKPLFHDSKSRAGPVLMHTKMIIATFQEIRKGQTNAVDTDTDDDIEVIESAVGWVYVGSHNFTAAAWGRISGKDSKGVDPTLENSNYELGVVFPLTSEAEVEKVACFQRPLQKYRGDDKPWIQDDSKILREYRRTQQQ